MVNFDDQFSNILEEGCTSKEHNLFIQYEKHIKRKNKQI